MRTIRDLLILLVLWATCVPAAEMAYVIKVDNALIYLDVGSKAGAGVGDWYSVLDSPPRKKASGRIYDRIGEVRLVRVFEEVSIAEVISLGDGKELKILQRAVSSPQWAAIEEQLNPASSAPKTLSEPDTMDKAQQKMQPVRPKPLLNTQQTRSIYILGGGDWNKDINLLWDATDQLVGTTGVTDRSLGLRLANTRAPWRLNLTYRIAGKPLGAVGADITQWGLEADMHYILTRAWPPKLYLGAGLGVHQMSWKARGDIGQPENRRKVDTQDSTTRWGLQLVAGSEWGLGGGWALAFEGGYYHVFKWEGLIGGSGLRSWVGIGQAF